MYNTAPTRSKNTAGTRNVTLNGTNNYVSTREDEYSSKLIVGSVIGVGLAIFLITILAKTFVGNGGPPPSKPGTVALVSN